MLQFLLDIHVSLLHSSSDHYQSIVGGGQPVPWFFCINRNISNLLYGKCIAPITFSFFLKIWSGHFELQSISKSLQTPQLARNEEPSASCMEKLPPLPEGQFASVVHMNMVG